jgi:hypothetical protein
MKKAVLSIALILLMAACLPLTPASPTPPVVSNVDNAGTAEAMLKTAIAQTLAVLPTSTPLPAVDTATSTATSSSGILPTLTPDIAMTATQAAIDTAQFASTGTFEAITSTPILVAFPAGSATMTHTPAVLTYGTLPPAVPFAYVTLVNRAKTQAYISLQVVTTEGGPTIMEYPVRGRIRVQAPVGQYLYVAWVGGRKMVGEFRLHKEDDLEIFLYRDRVEVR